MPPPSSPPPSPLRYLYPGWYAVVMGLSGLSLAWFRAEASMGPAAAGVARSVGALAAAALILLAFATLLRGWRHPDAWREDRAHPVRHTFIATLPVSVMLVATVGVAAGLPRDLLSPLWWAGSLGQWFVTAWVLSRWWGRWAWPSVTPALFIPVVGNVLAPLAGVPLGFSGWSAAQFGVGLLFWPLVLGLLLTRIAVHGPWPDRLRPTLFIVIAPPAVIGLAAAQLGAPQTLVWMCWGVALFALTWVGTQAKAIAAMPFGLTHWALSFPLAALAALTLHLSTTSAALVVPGVALLALTSLVVAALLLATARGLRNGSLLAPEPVASIVPAAG